MFGNLLTIQWPTEVVYAKELRFMKGIQFIFDRGRIFCNATIDDNGVVHFKCHVNVK